MIVGQKLEQGVLALYEHVTGRKVDYCNVTSQHPERPWQVYTPDALCVGERRGVDAKVVFWDQRRKWGATANDIPERVQLQAWWYISAMDYDAWDICALVGEELPRIYTIVRDREVERVMLAKCEEFYRRYLIGDETPPIIQPGAAVDRYLQHAFPTHKRPDIREATEEEAGALEEYAQIRIDYKELEGMKKRAEMLFKLAIAHQEGLQWENGKITWRLTKDKTVTRWEGMALALLNAHVKDPEVRAQVLADHQYTKTGGRRLRFEYDGIVDEGGDE
jgi:predicted phage-related endonuclease